MTTLPSRRLGALGRSRSLAASISLGCRDGGQHSVLTGWVGRWGGRCAGDQEGDEKSGAEHFESAIDAGGL